VQVETYKDTDGKLKFSDTIILDRQNNLPEYSEQSFLALIGWLKETFAK
jgi:hypothetical protein